MPNLLISASNLNLEPRDIAIGNIGSFQSFLQDGGYKAGGEIYSPDVPYVGGGFQWTDIRTVHDLFALMEKGLAYQLAEDGGVSSLHQSWRTTTVPRDIIPRFWHPRGEWNGVPNSPTNNVKAVGRALLTPLLNSSFNRLETIQAAIGPLPIIAHPVDQSPPGGTRSSRWSGDRPRIKMDYPVEADRFGGVWHQPSPEVLDAWGVLGGSPEETIDSMLDIQQAHGFEGVAWDTQHARETRQGRRFRDPDAMVARLAELGKLDAIQLNFGGDTTDLENAANGNLAGTAPGRALHAALGSLGAGSTLRVVTEIPASSFRAAGISNVTEGNRRVVEAVLEMAA